MEPTSSTAGHRLVHQNRVWTGSSWYWAATTEDGNRGKANPQVVAMQVNNGPDRVQQGSQLVSRY
jgi:hypothetical protein